VKDHSVPSPYISPRKWGFIDTAGKSLVPSFRDDAVRPFASGMAAVMTRLYNLPSPYAYTESWCFIGPSGSPINCPAGLLEVRDFVGNTAMVRTRDGWGYLDKNGNYSRTAPGQTPTPTPTRDTAAPQLTVTSHRSGAVVSATSITLRGSATDMQRGGSGISSVTVNGRAVSGGTATGNGTASWTWSAALARGSNTFTIIATDGSPARNRTTVTVTIRRP
jgi:hypothetical protein